MARKITVFELHFDGARFGPTFGGRTGTVAGADDHDDTAMTPDVEPDSDTAGASRIRRALPLVVGVGIVSVMGRLAVRRFRGSRGDEDGLEVSDAGATDEPIAR